MSVELLATTSEIMITVVDDGSGIPIEQRERVFSRFVRLGAADGPEGSGLGLAIVRSAAARLNATIGFGEVRHGTAIILTFFKELVGEQRHPAIEAYVISNGELIAP